MQLSPGNIVRSIAGRDRDHLYVVVAITPERVLVADGSRRGINRPKPKNPNHLQLLKRVGSCLSADGDIRQILREFSAEQSQICDKKGGNN